MEAHTVELQPWHRASEDRHDVRLRRVLGARLRARKLMSAARADVVGKRDQLAAVRTTLSGDSVDLHAARAPFFATNIDAGAAIDGTVPPDVACKIQNEAVPLILGKPSPATDHLHVQAGAQCRPQHRQQVDLRNIEAGRQHVDISQRPDVAAAEGSDDASALRTGRGAGDHFSAHATLAQCIAHVAGVTNATTKDQPRAPVAAALDDLVGRPRNDGAIVSSLPELGGNELPTTAAYATHAHPRPRGPRR